MSRKSRRTPPPPKPEPTDPDEPEAPDPPDSEPGESPEPELAAAIPFAALAKLGLDQDAAVFLAAYARVRPAEAPDDLADLPGLVSLARQCMGHPWVWSALRRGDWMGFARALDICGLPAASAADLQRAVTELQAGAPDSAPPRASRTDTDRASALADPDATLAP